MKQSAWLLPVLGFVLFSLWPCQAEGDERPAAGAKLRAKIRAHAGGAYCLAFSPDGKALASGGRDRAVKLWDVATGEVTATLGGQAGPVWSVAFGPDGKTLVA